MIEFGLTMMVVVGVATIAMQIAFAVWEYKKPVVNRPLMDFPFADYSLVKPPVSRDAAMNSAMHRIDALLAHVWMVRTFLKHSEEAEEDDELRDVHRALYDYLLALGESWKAQDADAYLRQAKKKYSKLRRATDQFCTIQPEISSHTNFQMAAASLRTAVDQIGEILNGVA